MLNPQTFVDVDTVQRNLDDPTWLLVDCRAVLGDVEGGRRAYEADHLPGAVFADLETDLSGPIVTGATGRHPLPDPEQVAELFGSWGMTEATQLVAYDADRGFLAASRLWWMALWVGHDRVAVLDGGMAAWQAAGHPTVSATAGAPSGSTRPATTYDVAVRPELVADTDELAATTDRDGPLVVDSRSADRYRGENETIDPVAGHITGAPLRPFLDNFTATGIRPASELSNEFAALTGDRSADGVVYYCGSGVTAAANLIASAHAGHGLPRLYPGSWSHWITDPDRPVETGDPTSSTGPETPKR